VLDTKVALRPLGSRTDSDVLTIVIDLDVDKILDLVLTAVIVVATRIDGFRLEIVPRAAPHFDAVDK